MKNLRRAQRNEWHTQISDNQFPYFSQRAGRNRSKDFRKWHEEKDYFVRSCIYNRVCVVGKKETVYQIVERLQKMENRLVELAEQIDSKKPEITSEEMRDLQEAYEDMLKAILWMLDGAKYLWQGEEKAPTAATVRAVITGKPLLSTITIQV